MPWVLLRGITHSAGHRIHLNASSPHTHRLPVNPYPHSTLIATALLPDLASQLFFRGLAEIFFQSLPHALSLFPTICFCTAHPPTHPLTLSGSSSADPFVSRPQSQKHQKTPKEIRSMRSRLGLRTFCCLQHKCSLHFYDSV